MRYRRLIVAIATVGIFLPWTASAQGFDFINVKTNPKTPGVNQEVTVSLESFGVDLDASEIIWYLDKDPIKQGVGEKSIVVHTGDFGDKQDLRAVILSNLGKRFEKTIDLTPSEIDLLWEAKTYTPPFYKGKALPTFKSAVKVTAIPRRGRASSDPKAFVYDWKYNRTLGVGKGLGKDSVTIQMGYADTPVPVSVDVSLLNSDEWRGYLSRDIVGTEALVRFYEQAPLLGIGYGRALAGSAAPKGSRYSIKAVPYYFSTEDIVDEVLIYTWRLNGRNAVPGLDPTVLTIDRSGTAAERDVVDLRIQTPRHLLQEGGARVVVDFEPEEQQ